MKEAVGLSCPAKPCHGWLIWNASQKNIKMVLEQLTYSVLIVRIAVEVNYKCKTMAVTYKDDCSLVSKVGITTL